MWTTKRLPRGKLVWIAGGVLLAGIAIVAVGAMGKKDTGAASAATAAGPASAARAALTVEATTPQSGAWPQTIAANGNVAAWQEAVIGVETQGLRLTDVLVQVGDRVQRGQVLARLQSETTGAEAAASRAAVVEAQAALAEAEANADRANQLKQSGAISSQQIQQYVTGAATARARVAALQAQAHAAEVRLQQTRIVAPDDGVISARSAAVGAVASPGQELFRLIRQNRLEWRAEVPAPDLARLKPGMPVSITPAGGKPVTGKLRMVGPTVDAATRNGLVYVDLPQPGDAKAGMFARGEFELGRTQGLTLPQSAVLLREGYAYVFRIGRDDKVTQTKVSVGRRLGDRIEVTSGVDPNTRVVAQGAGFLADGDTVKVVGKAAAPAAPAASVAKVAAASK